MSYYGIQREVSSTYVHLTTNKP